MSQSVAGRTRHFRRLSVHFFKKLLGSGLTQTRTVTRSPVGLALVLRAIGRFAGLSAFSQSLPRCAIHYFCKPVLVGDFKCKETKAALLGTQEGGADGRPAGHNAIRVLRRLRGGPGICMKRARTSTYALRRCNEGSTKPALHVGHQGNVQ